MLQNFLPLPKFKTLDGRYYLPIRQNGYQVARDHPVYEILICLCPQNPYHSLVAKYIPLQNMCSNDKIEQLQQELELMEQIECSAFVVETMDKCVSGNGMYLIGEHFGMNLKSLLKRDPSHRLSRFESIVILYCIGMALQFFDQIDGIHCHVIAANVVRFPFTWKLQYPSYHSIKKGAQLQMNVCQWSEEDKLYLPPEFLNNKTIDQNGKGDIWGLAVIVLEAFVGPNSAREIVYQILQGHNYCKMPECWLGKLLTQMLSINPSSRPSSSQLIEEIQQNLTVFEWDYLQVLQQFQQNEYKYFEKDTLRIFEFMEFDQIVKGFDEIEKFAKNKELRNQLKGVLINNFLLCRELYIIQYELAQAIIQCPLQSPLLLKTSFLLIKNALVGIDFLKGQAQSNTLNTIESEKWKFFSKLPQQSILVSLFETDYATCLKKYDEIVYKLETSIKERNESEQQFWIYFNDRFFLITQQFEKITEAYIKQLIFFFYSNKQSELLHTPIFNIILKGLVNCYDMQKYFQNYSLEQLFRWKESFITATDEEVWDELQQFININSLEYSKYFQLSLQKEEI